MQPRGFHHPDFSLPVLRRRAAEELLDLLTDFARLLATRGKSLDWNHTFPTQGAYWAALSRLRKAGLIVERRQPGRTPVLLLDEAATSRSRPGCGSRFPWQKRWIGVWYVLVYDVPESERRYRNVLRQFLRRMRMGKLQGSVWISPHDIRPQYDDLVKAASARSYTFLFASKTVLRQKPADLIGQAWKMEELVDMQKLYCDVCAERLRWIRSNRIATNQLLPFAREEQAAYLGLMDRDPLLPVDLWPKPYLGRQVWETHQGIVAAIARAA